MTGRQVGFVSTEPKGKERFKYWISQYHSKIAFKLLDAKRFLNTHVEKIKKYLSLIIFKQIAQDVATWLIEAIIEGLLINYVANVLFHATFTIPTILAYGILIKKATEWITDILQVTKHATNTEIPKDAGTGKSKSR